MPNPHQFSGGMRQRVAIASAFTQAQLIIADEPTTALDVTIQAQILAEDAGARERARWLWITHDLAVVSRLADEIASCMRSHRRERAGRRRAGAARAPYTAGLIGSVRAAPARRAPRADPGHEPSLVDLPEGCAFRTPLRPCDAACLKDPPPVCPAARVIVAVHPVVAEVAA